MFSSTFHRNRHRTNSLPRSLPPNRRTIHGSSQNLRSQSNTTSATAPGKPAIPCHRPRRPAHLETRPATTATKSTSPILPKSLPARSVTRHCQLVDARLCHPAHHLAILSWEAAAAAAERPAPLADPANIDERPAPLQRSKRAHLVIA